jgi:UDP-N-acetylmuramoyl-tripeptide--D-alanyl-D-alanine ligase
LITVGERARAFGEGAALQGFDATRIHCCRDHEEAQAVLRAQLTQRPWIFLKASRGMKLEKLLEGL